MCADDLNTTEVSRAGISRAKSRSYSAMSLGSSANGTKYGVCPTFLDHRRVQARSCDEVAASVSAGSLHATERCLSRVKDQASMVGLTISAADAPDHGVAPRTRDGSTFWASYSFVYRPPANSSSWWVPSSATRPFCSTMMRSATAAMKSMSWLITMQVRSSGVVADDSRNQHR